MSIEDDYTSNLLKINKNLRDQLENCFKLLKLKTKENNNIAFNKLENLINELEILKTSLTFSLQKQTEIIRSIRNIDTSNFIEKINSLSEKLNEKENLFKEITDENHRLKQNLISEEKKNLENLQKISDMNKDINMYVIEIHELKKFLDEEKIKAKNLLNLIKDLEKKKSNEKLEKEAKMLKEQVDMLLSKLKEFEGKYKSKIEHKDSIILKLDNKLSEYEAILNSK
jgi:hypothetical protein